jgi:hypothetical protein
MVLFPVKGFEGRYSVSTEGDVFSHVTTQFMTRLSRGKTGYLFVRIAAEVNGKKKAKNIHRIMGETYLGATRGQMVDHKDGDRANNDLNNLRLCDNRTNQYNSKIWSNNTTGFRGVWFNKRKKRFTANICVNGKNQYLGGFLTAEEAGQAYDDAAKKLHGDFYRSNLNVNN